LTPERITGWREQPNNWFLRPQPRWGQLVGSTLPDDGLKSAGVIWISTGHWNSLDSTPGRVPLVPTHPPDRRHPRRHPRIPTPPGVEGDVGLCPAPWTSPSLFRGLTETAQS